MGVSVRGGLVVGGSLLRVVFMVWFCRTGPSEKLACALPGRGCREGCNAKMLRNVDLDLGLDFLLRYKE